MTYNDDTPLITENEMNLWAWVVLSVLFTSFGMAQDTNPALEFLNGDRTTFSTQNHAKAKGIHFTIAYPNSWVAKEGERPNIVQTFVSEKGRGMEMATIVTRALPTLFGKTITEADREDYFSATAMENMVPQGATFIRARRSKIEGLDAGIVEYSVRDQRAGMTISMQGISYIFIHGSIMVQLQFAVAGSNWRDDISRRMELFKPLFTLMANSIVIPEIWDDAPELSASSSLVPLLFSSSSSNQALGSADSNYAEYVTRIRSLAEQGHSDAQAALGGLYMDNNFGVPQDLNEAVNWFRLAAQQGQAVAQSTLGNMYREGYGVPQDYEEAVKWLHLAAEQGDVLGQTGLGECFGKGLGVPQDFVESEKWYRKAAEQGEVNAQFNLGVYYVKGLGLPKNVREGIKWWRLAAEQGLVEAQAGLGMLYLGSQEIPQDDQEGIKWLLLAADSSNVGVDVLTLLGTLYRTGDSVIQDYVQAHMWYNLAAAKGYDDAALIRDALAVEMIPADISAAQKMAREWMKANP